MKRKAKRIIAIILLVCTIFTCTTSVYAKSKADRIKAMLRSRILFEDLAKFNEAVDTNDGGKIFQAVLEIYPGLVELSKECAEENNPVGTILSSGNTLVLSSAIVIAGGMVAAAIIVVNKKKNEKREVH